MRNVPIEDMKRYPLKRFQQAVEGKLAFVRAARAHAMTQSPAPVSFPHQPNVPTPSATAIHHLQAVSANIELTLDIENRLILWNDFRTSFTLYFQLSYGGRLQVFPSE